MVFTMYLSVLATGGFPWAFTAVYVFGAVAAVVIGISALKRATQVNIEQMDRADQDDGKS
jgi:hypothetical protein